MKTKCIKNSPKKVVINKFTKNDKLFMVHVKEHCKQLGVKCDLRQTKKVRCGPNTMCAGYFDSDNKILVVSMLHPDSFAVLVHEYCHLTQWQEDIDFWNASGESLHKVDRWLQGHRVHNIYKHLAVSRDLELDNERRSVRMIKKWNLSIDVDDYIRKANAYVQFYNWMYYSRKWSKPGNSPYTNKAIIATMSNKFNMNYDEMTRKVYNAFLEADI